MVAPPDPVAAPAVAGRLGLPRRMVSLLEGEGLFNDVTAIVLYHVAIVAAVTGAFSWPGALAEFALSAVVAVLVGFGLGWLSARLMDLLGDATLQVGLSLLVPFVSYALADELHGSGVLAVLTTSFYLGDRTADADDVLGRFAAGTFWQVVETLVTGVAFGLIGLELHAVLGTEQGRLRPLLAWGGAVVAVVVLVRLLWLLPAAWLAKRTGGARRADTEIPLSWRETVVMWWAGMRGVASVALVLAIPLTLADGSPFPERAVIVFIAFAVVLVTLLAQGLTLPWLVGRLGVKADTAAERELEKRLAVAAARAAKRRLREIDAAEDLPEEVVEQLARRMMGFGLWISPEAGEEERREAYEARARRVRLVRRVQGEMLSAARQAVLDARRDPYADPAVVSRVLRRLDARSLR
ncbi:cation:proton antiporter [Actinomadura luzonensis]|uniref:cation:proton antiporter n=1 Tax=Actinomadura luzonensis TaxID=2805427 RepID=UPI002E21948C